LASRAEGLKGIEGRSLLDAVEEWLSQLGERDGLRRDAADTSTRGDRLLDAAGDRHLGQRDDDAATAMAFLTITARRRST
jgi:ABC-type phosphonate transport system ATPase subunit